MTILFDATKPVKTTRNRPFGLGIARQRDERLPYGPTHEDAAWWAYEANKDCRDYEVVSTAEDRHFDRMAAEFHEMDLLCRGVVLD